MRMHTKQPKLGTQHETMREKPLIRAPHELSKEMSPTQKDYKLKAITQYWKHNAKIMDIIWKHLQTAMGT